MSFYQFIVFLRIIICWFRFQLILQFQFVVGVVRISLLLLLSFQVLFCHIYHIVDNDSYVAQKCITCRVYTSSGHLYEYMLKLQKKNTYTSAMYSIQYFMQVYKLYRIYLYRICSWVLFLECFIHSSSNIYIFQFCSLIQ